MSVRVQSANFDVGVELAALRVGADIGALVSFTGIVRGASQLELEHYPGMTEKALVEIEAKAVARWDLRASLIVHRYGVLLPGEQIVLVAAAAGHRQAAFEAAEFMMDYLKSEAPFWKKEGVGADAHWVDARVEDGVAMGRWGATLT